MMLFMSSLSPSLPQVLLDSFSIYLFIYLPLGVYTNTYYRQHNPREKKKKIYGQKKWIIIQYVPAINFPG